MKLEKDKFYSFKIKDRKREKQGFLIAEGEDWFLIQSLFTDYMIDGYMLLNKNYVSEINRDNKVAFTEKVLITNDKLPKSPNVEVPLSSSLLFEWLEEHKMVFQIDNKEEDKSWIGRILDSTNKSIFLTPLTPLGEWRNSSYYTFRQHSIRIISFDSAYINSLLKYSETLDV